MKNTITKIVSRVSAVALAVLVLSCALLGFVVPSSAVSKNGGNNYGVLHFDEWRSGSGSAEIISSWNGNIFPAAGVGQFDGPYGQFYAEQFLDQGEGRIDFYGNTDFTLVSYWQKVDVTALRDFRVYFGFDGVDRYRVNVSFEVVQLAENSWYQLKTDLVTVSYSSINSAGQPMQLGNRMADGIQEVTNSQYVAISNLRISFTAVELDDPEGIREIDLFIPLQSSSPAKDVPLWIDQQYFIVEHIYTEPLDDDFLGWLWTWANSFLNTPIIGSFSFGGLLVVFISISLCILLAKILG